MCKALGLIPCTTVKEKKSIIKEILLIVFLHQKMLSLNMTIANVHHKVHTLNKRFMNSTSIKILAGTRDNSWNTGTVPTMSPETLQRLSI